MGELFRGLSHLLYVLAFTAMKDFIMHNPARSLNNSLISVGVLKTLGLLVSIRDGVLKMTKGSMVVMKGVRRNNLYYLKGSIVTGQVETSISSDDVYTYVWQMRLGHGGEKSLQAPAKKGLLEGASTCNLKLGEYGILDKKKVKFGTTTHHSEGLLDCVHVGIWESAKLHRLEIIGTLSLLLIIYLGIVGYIP